MGPRALNTERVGKDSTINKLMSSGQGRGRAWAAGREQFIPPKPGSRVRTLLGPGLARSRERHKSQAV